MFVPVVAPTNIVVIASNLYFLGPTIKGILCFHFVAILNAGVS